MKKKSPILMSALILLSTLSQPIFQGTTAKTKRSPVAANNAPLPDLIVTGSAAPYAKSGKFEISIKNVGAATAGESYVVLIVYHKSSQGVTRPTEMRYHAKVLRLAIGQVAHLVIETNLNVIYDKQCTIADGTNQVVESNEDNNKCCAGAIGGIDTPSC